MSVAEARLVPVQFIKSTVTYHDGLQRSYAAGEQAAFDPEHALLLVSVGNAVRAHRANHPLVQAALTYPDQEAQRLAGTLQSLVPDLGNLEALAVRVGKDLARSKAADEGIMVRDGKTHLPEEVAEASFDPERQAKMADHLAMLERKIDTLLRREAELFEELKAKVTSGFERQADAIIKDLVPVWKSLTNLIKQSRDQFAILSATGAALTTVRTAAACAGLDTQLIDRRLAAATGVTALPDKLQALLTQQEARR